MGRPKGAKNRKTSAEVVRAKSQSGEMPLDYMLRIMRTKSVPVERRDDMAKAAANYVHSKLQASTVAHTGTLTLESLVTEAIKNPPAE